MTSSVTRPAVGARLAPWTAVRCCVRLGVILCAAACTATPASTSPSGGAGAAGAETSGTAGGAAGASAGADAAPPHDAAAVMDVAASGNGGGGVQTDGAAGGASAGSDAGSDAVPAATACPSGALLCDDFESYTTPASLAAAWTVTATGATLVVDGSKPHAGKQGVHVSAAGGTPVGVLIKQGAPLFPIAGNAYYGRMMMWLTQAPTGAVHWNNVQSAGFLAGSTQWGKYGWGGMFGTILAGYTIRTNATDMQAITDCSKPSTQKLPEKAWVCVEWQFDGVGNELHLWLDGKLVSDADVVQMGTQCVTPKPPGGIWGAPTFANLTLGWAQYQTSSVALSMWMDDVVVSAQRAGCPAP